MKGRVAADQVAVMSQCHGQNTDLSNAAMSGEDDNFSLKPLRKHSEKTFVTWLLRGALRLFATLAKMEDPLEQCKEALVLRAHPGGSSCLRSSGAASDRDFIRVE